MIDDVDLQERVKQLQMSEAMQGITTMAYNYPADLSDADSRATAFVTCVVAIAKCLDANEIVFKTTNSEAMLYGLLALAMKTGFPNLQIKKVAVQ